jgi:hypothetical protein
MRILNLFYEIKFIRKSAVIPYRNFWREWEEQFIHQTGTRMR